MLEDWMREVLLPGTETSVLNAECRMLNAGIKILTRVGQVVYTPFLPIGCPGIVSG
jgi:hypothetical protein